MSKINVLTILSVLLFLFIPVCTMASMETQLLAEISIIPEQEILEDSQSQSIPFTISSSTLMNTITVSIFSDQPDIIPNDDQHIHLIHEINAYTMILMPAPDAFGDVGITILATDVQSITQTQQFQVHVIPVNDPPFFQIKEDQIVITEDDGLYEISDWATHFSTGPDNEADQKLLIDIQTDHEDFFSTQPQLSPFGLFRFVPASDVYGTAIISITIRDDGGDEYEGMNKFTNNVQLTILPVNDPPSFQKGDDIVVLEDSGIFRQPSWATHISAGPFENDQITSFNLSTSNHALFQSLPMIMPDGMLMFIPAFNQYGQSRIDVQIMDNADINNRSETVSFTITIQPVNDPPSFVKGEDITVKSSDGLQEFPDWIQEMHPGSGESDQNIQFQCEVNHPELFKELPFVSESGTLTFFPKPIASGQATVTIQAIDSGGTDHNGIDISPMQMFTIHILYSPEIYFDIQSELNILEDADETIIPEWASNISPQMNDHIQDIVFVISTEQSELFRTFPQLTKEGSLRLQPEANSVGTAELSVVLKVVLKDSSIKTSETKFFSIHIGSVNDPPVFTIEHPSPILEDSGQQSISLITSCSPGPEDESNQKCDYIIDIDSPDLFATQPQITPDGILHIQPVDNVFGASTLRITAKDNGGTENNGQDTSAVISAQLIIEPVNDCPSFLGGNDIQISNTNGNQVFVNWAKNITAGPNESFQNLDFIVTCDNPGIFTEQPTIEPNGTLKFTPSINQYGTSVVDVYLKDNGGFSNNGCDMSQLFDFSITTLPEKSLTIQIEGQGTVLLNDDQVIEDLWTQTFQLSSNIHLSARQNSGWIFSHWSGDMVSELSDIDIVMNASKTITAHFMQVSSTVMLDIQGNGWILLNETLLSLPVQKKIQKDTWLSITALPEDRFQTWKGDIVGYTNPVTIQITDDFFMEAQFVEISEWTLDLWLESDDLEITQSPKVTIGVASQEHQEPYYLAGDTCEIMAIDATSLDRYSENILAQSPAVEKYQWIIAINPKGDACDPMKEFSVTIHWHAYQLNPAGFYTISRGVDEEDVIIHDMRQDHMLSVTGMDGYQYYMITWIPYNAFHTFELVSGWNLISLPLIPEDNSLSKLFPDADIAYGYQNGEYYRALTLEPGSGYWVNMNKANTYKVFGDIYHFSPIYLEPGWHLIGSLQHKAETSTDMPVINVMYQYTEGAYSIAQEIEPGLGYWIKLTEPAMVNIME
jgi:hypothetical protein